MLDIDDLHVEIADKEILRGLTLRVAQGEVHAIMGPNGSGKSTLAHVLAGRSEYEVVRGRMRLKGRSLTDMDPEERAHLGLFLAFQYPIELPGVTAANFLRQAVNAKRRAHGHKEWDVLAFARFLREKAEMIGISPELLKRPVNLGFSGGEKKRNEILQMAVLDPSLAILDETDSGLDIDALKAVASSINALRSPHRSILLITHYQRLLTYVVPDVVHVMVRGRIVRSGDKHLALELESQGYVAYEEKAEVACV